VPRVVGLAVVHYGFSSVEDAPRPGAVVGVAANGDGIVPGRHGGGAVVRVAANDDGAVPRRPGGGTRVADVVLDIADDDALEDPKER